MKYTLTNDSIIITHAGKTYVVRAHAPNFKSLRTAILNEDWRAVVDCLTVSGTIHTWAKGRFTVNGNDIEFDGMKLPQELTRRIHEMVAQGESPQALFNFWERLQKNPSMRSVEQLWSFLNHQGIPLTPVGTFLAYKAVREDYLDYHSAKFDNRPGAINEMPRNQISDDPNHACHQGFHVGALEYAREFGESNKLIMVCEVDPADVVCVPYDSSAQKMRVCKYKVVGHHNEDSHLSSSVHHNDEDAFAEKIVEQEATSVSEFDRLDNESPVALMQESMETLRRYASRHLRIIGAHKIPGGKTSLISSIMKVRRAQKGRGSK